MAAVASLSDQEAYDYLMKAAVENDIGSLQVLLDGGSSPNRYDATWGHTTPLSAAAWKGNSEAVELLLSKGADPNLQDGDGRVPLHWGAWNGRKISCKLLLDAGANPNTRSVWGWTALHCAAYHGHPSDCYVDIRRDNPQCTFIEPNLENNAAADEDDYNGNQAVCQLLLSAGVDKSVKGNKGETAADLARFRHHDALAEWLEGSTAEDDEDGGSATKSKKP